MIMVDNEMVVMIERYNDQKKNASRNERREKIIKREKGQTNKRQEKRNK